MGSPGQVENHPKDRCESNHDSPSSRTCQKRSATDQTSCRAWKLRIANTKRRTCSFIAARHEMAFFLCYRLLFVHEFLLSGTPVRRRDELKGKGRWPVAGAPGTVVSQMFQQPAPYIPSLTYVQIQAVEKAIDAQGRVHYQRLIGS